jgi:hypothetical protein
METHHELPAGCRSMLVLLKVSPVPVQRLTEEVCEFYDQFSLRPPFLELYQIGCLLAKVLQIQKRTYMYSRLGKYDH